VPEVAYALGVVLRDQPVQVDIDEVLARRGPPVPEDPGLDVRRLERRAQERIVHQVDLADGEVIAARQ
jgi:hypothetical protein